MADAELLLTIDGSDVTADVWQWRSVTLTDAWTAHPTLSFVLRQPFGSVTDVGAYADVRLVNLLTGVVLFEGIVAPGTTEAADVDPTWAETSVSCVGYQALLDSAMVGTPVTVPASIDASTDPTAVDVVRRLLAVGFADARVNVSPSWYPYGGSWASLVISPTADRTWPQWTNLQQAIGEVLRESTLWNAGFTVGSQQHPHLAKIIPGQGMVITAPDKAVRGAAPVTLTAASFGRPSRAGRIVDTTRTASAAVFKSNGGADQLFYGPDAVNGLLGAYQANNYVVLRDVLDIDAGDSWYDYFVLGDGATSTYYEIVSPLMPHDVLVGHEITFDTARLGSLTGVVQSIRTTFADGMYDQSAANWPYFLDGGRTLDGTWNLDASNSSVIARRRRTTTMTVAVSSATPGTSRAFVQTLRRNKVL